MGISESLKLIDDYSFQITIDVSIKRYRSLLCRTLGIFMNSKNSLLILALVVAVFGVITTEMGIIGLLPKLTSQLNVSAAQVGLLVSLYALIVAVTGPFITLGLSKFNKKTVLLSILFVFIVSNIIYALTETYNLMLAFRILPALGHAVFFSVALVVATNSVSEDQKTGAAAKVFGGVAFGLVLGVPLSTILAENISLSVAFYFAALACFIAFLGVLFLMPSMPSKEKISFSSQLIILRKVKLWMAIITVTMIFSAMFSSFSYIADYLSKITHLDNNYISILLIIFGVFGLVGNFIFSHFLQKNAVKTTMYYPILFSVIFILIWLFGFSILAMVLLTVFWGIFHSSGLVISQNWLLREAEEAPEFANSLYMSFANLGITIGSIVGGWFITHFGTHSVILSSILFALIAFSSIYIKNRSDNF